MQSDCRRHLTGQTRRRTSRSAPAARPRRRSRASGAAGAKVDLGVLPRLLGYNLRRAHQVSWRTYVSFIGENKIRPGLFSLLCLVRANPGIAQIELGTHLGCRQGQYRGAAGSARARRTDPAQALDARSTPPGHLPDRVGQCASSKR